jgi:hypothetical protein
MFLLRLVAENTPAVPTGWGDYLTAFGAFAPFALFLIIVIWKLWEDNKKKDDQIVNKVIPALVASTLAIQARNEQEKQDRETRETASMEQMLKSFSRQLAALQAEIEGRPLPSKPPRGLGDD